MKSLMNLVVSALIELNLEIQPIPTAQHNMQSLMNLVVSALSCETASRETHTNNYP